MKPGIYEDVPYDDYAAIDAMNNTGLGRLAQSPAYFQYCKKFPPEETPALKLGKAVHAKVLQPIEFAQDYVREIDVTTLINPRTDEPYVSPRASKPYKEWVAQMADMGKTVLKDDEYTYAGDVADAMYRHPRISHLLETAKGQETTLVWVRDGRLCKCRIDLWGDGWWADVKTTNNYAGFVPWEIEKYNLHRQAAWYRSGMLACALNPEAFFVPLVSKASPEVALFNMERGAIEAGAAECDRLWKIYTSCLHTGKWPERYDPEIVHSATLSDRTFDRLEEEGLL